MLCYEYTQAEWQFSRATRVTGVYVLIIIKWKKKHTKQAKKGKREIGEE